MKKMSKFNNKGFSLTGLLAVIAIFSVVICISLYFYTNIMNTAKSKSYQVTISNVEKKANNYVTQKKPEIFYLTKGNGKIEYQCITIGELIEMGYLDADILNSEVDFDGDTISRDDYIYIEKNANSQTILKSVYDKNNQYQCADMVKARGDITFVVSPNVNTWSQKKIIDIKYKIKNGSNASGKNYQYKYLITDSKGNIIKTNTNADKHTKLEMNEIGTIIAEIIDNDGQTLIQKILNIGMIDKKGPVIELNGAVVNGNVNNNIKLPIIVTDTESGINDSSIDKTDFEVTIGGTKLPISSLELTKMSETTGKIKYELSITDNTYRGKLEIKIAANSCFDKIENGNEETKFNLNITMNKIYKVIADSRGGSITTASGWTGTGASVTKNLTYGEPYGPLPIVTKPGYKFIGWYTAASGGEKINPGTVVTISSTQIIYARWQTDTYKVSLAATGGTITSTSGWIASGGSAYKNIPYGSTYGNMPIPTRTGYTFQGWWTTVSSGGIKISNTTLATVTTNHTLYARWTTATYQVTANATGGKFINSNGWTSNGSIATKNVSYASKYGTLPTPTREGYNFTGWWTTASSGGIKITETTMVNTPNNHTIYARWSVNSYKVIANANGGTITTTSGWTGSGASAYKNVVYNNNYGILPTPTRAGYNFTGWYTSSSGGIKIESNTKVTNTTQHIIFARWTPNANTVTANANGGHITSASGWTSSSGNITKNVTYTGQYGTLPSATRTGYTFEGWYTLASGGNQITPATRVTNPNSHTIYARWKANNYRINANATGGTITATSGWTGTGASVNKTILFDSPYGTLPTPTKAGYNFTGWWTLASGGTQVNANTKLTSASQVTIYAHWTANNYKVTIIPTSGNFTNTSSWVVSGGTATKTFAHGNTLGALPTVTRQGYTFKGWYSASSGGTAITNVTLVTSERTIYAQWTGATYQLTANANGGSVTSTSGWTGSGSISKKNVIYTEQYGILPTPTREGYNFAGWYTSATGGTKIESTTRVTTSASHTIYARWTKNSYTVTINPTGGSITNSNGWTSTGSGATKVFQYGSSYGTFPSVTKPGYTFTGWYTASSGGSSITSGTQVTQNITIYARWTTATVSVTANANGGAISSTSGWTGSGSIAKKTVTYSGQYGTLPTPTRQGYTFAGWYTTSSGGNLINSSTRVTNTSAHTIYARWTTNSYTVTINPTGGSITSSNGWTISSGSATKLFTYGSSYGTFPTVSKTGYTFNGWWTTASSGGSSITTGTQVTQNNTIYARWTSASYKVVIDANGGSIPSMSGWTGTGSSAYKMFTYGSQFGNIPTPTRNSYTFDGWYTAASGGSKIISTTMVSNNPPQRLYAHWTAASCVLKFNKNTSDSGVTLTTTTKVVSVGEEYGTLDIPVYSTTAAPGQTIMIFTGWYTSSSGGTPVTSTTVCTNAGTTTLYAGWTYTVVPMTP